MSTEIHPTAIVDPGAGLGQNVIVGPYCVIDAEVVIGDGCRIGPFSRLTGKTKIGSDNVFESHASVGAPPQDLKYAGEPTRLEIADNNVFREFVTIHRGTPGGGGITRIGSNSLFMAYVHVAHDCQVGDQVIFANNATLAGHVEVEDDATVGAFCAVHQFCTVGHQAFIGGGSIVTKDALPYMKTVGNRPAKCYGPNSIGLQRKGYSLTQRKALKDLWRLLHHPKLNTAQAIEKARLEVELTAEVCRVIDFIENSQRGVVL